MGKKAERIHLDRWIDRNKPNGLAKLAIESGVSVGTIQAVRAGVTPRKQTTRERLCAALGVPEHELFPSCKTEKSKVG